MTASGTGVYRRSSMRILDASQVRRSFAHAVESVADRREVVVIVRYGKAVAALVPLERLTKEERSAVFSRTSPAVSPVGRKRAGDPGS